MRRLAIALVLLAACNNDGTPAETDGAPPPEPETTDPSTTTGAPITTSSSTSGVPTEVCCEGSGGDLSCSACSDDSQFCSALRFFGEEVSGEDYLCRDECVPSEAAAYWCADDSSCCDAEATCNAQGFCRLPFEGTTGGSSGGSDSGSTSSGGEESSSSSSSSSSSGGEESSSSSSSSSGAGDGMG